MLKYIFIFRSWTPNVHTVVVVVVVGVAKTNFHFLIEKETLGQNDRSACLWRISLGSFSIFPFFSRKKKHEIRLLRLQARRLFIYLFDICCWSYYCCGLCRVNRDNIISNNTQLMWNDASAMTFDILRIQVVNGPIIDIISLKNMPTIFCIMYF